MAKLKGNACLLFLQRFANIALLIISLGFIAIGVFLIQQTKLFSIFPLAFIVIGGLEIILVFVSLCNETSKKALGFYIYTLLALVGIQTVVAVTTVIFKEQIIEWAGKNHSADQQAAKEFEELIRNNVEIAIYVALGASVVQVKIRGNYVLLERFCVWLLLVVIKER